MEQGVISFVSSPFPHDDQITENEMGWACGTYVERGEALHGIGGVT
jgi:hypothetical protein